MKSQGLPINFIVLIALAILVLVIAGLFFFGGFTKSSTSIDVQTAVNNCNAWCLVDAQKAKNDPNFNCATYNSTFCSKRINVTGMGSVYCDEITSCTVVDYNGNTCTLTCP